MGKKVVKKTGGPKPAKKPKVEEPPQQEEGEAMARLETVMETIMKKTAEFSAALEPAVIRRRKDALDEAMKLVPTLLKDAVLYNDVLELVTSEEDQAILDTVSELYVEENSKDPKDFKVFIKFSKPNEFFEDMTLWRGPVKASGIKWKAGKSPEERNKAAGLEPGSEESLYSLFELFSEGELPDDELPVLFSLRDVAADPIAAYLAEGSEADMDMEEDEEDDEDDEDDE